MKISKKHADYYNRPITKMILMTQRDSIRKIKCVILIKINGNESVVNRQKKNLLVYSEKEMPK